MEAILFILVTRNIFPYIKLISECIDPLIVNNKISLNQYLVKVKVAQLCPTRLLQARTLEWSRGSRLSLLQGIFLT